jgi:hypothetical protein
VLPRRDRDKRAVSKTPEEGRSAVINDTPRTDAAETNWWSEDGLRSAFIVRAEFARELEREMEQLRKERDEVRRLLKAVVDMMRDNMAPDAMHPKHVCDFIYCPEIATCMVCENWTDALVMCYPDDFQDEEETK